ncbi:hypothetical protein ATKI12_8612 [Kitasatospora sp. Ki12]
MWRECAHEQGTAHPGRPDPAAAGPEPRRAPVGGADPGRIPGVDGPDDRAARPHPHHADDARRPARPARRTDGGAGHRRTDPRRDPVLPRRRLGLRLARDRALADRAPGGQDRPAGLLAGLPARPRTPLPRRDRGHPGRLPRPPRRRHGPRRRRPRRGLRGRRPRRHHLPRRPGRGPAAARRRPGLLPGHRRDPHRREHGHQGGRRPDLHPRRPRTHRRDVPRRSRPAPPAAQPGPPRRPDRPAADAHPGRRQRGAAGRLHPAGRAGERGGRGRHPRRHRGRAARVPVLRRRPRRGRRGPGPRRAVPAPASQRSAGSRPGRLPTPIRTAGWAAVSPRCRAGRRGRPRHPRGR